MADIQTQLPVKLTDNTNTAAITAASALKVDASAVTQPVSGTVTNVPSGTQTVGGSVSVSNFPATQTVGGTVTSVTSGTQAVTGTVTTVTSGTQAVSGTVTNVPSGTQTVSGSVNIGNSPTVTIGNSPSVSVSNFPSTQPISGTVTNVPSGTQTVAINASSTIIEGEQGTGVVTFYGVSTTVAASSTGTISYTVTTGKTLYLKSVFASSSGAPCRVQVDFGAGPTILGVGFYAATAPSLAINFAQPAVIPSTSVVRVKVTNTAGSTQDLYATIMGVEY